MKKKLSYRDKLIELAYIYDVKEIKEYQKSRKNLTTGQLELILKKNKIIIPKIIDPERKGVIKNYCEPEYMEDHIEIIECDFDEKTGCIDIEHLNQILTNDVAGVYFEVPNYFGVIEKNGEIISSLCAKKGSETIVGCDPISLGILKSPIDYGADLVVGPVQPLGIHMNCGGGVSGFIASRDEEKYVREYNTLNISIAETELDGQYGFGLSLAGQTSYGLREAGKDWTGNSTYLWAISAAVYMALLGPQGFKEIGELIVQQSNYASKKISEIDGIKTCFISTIFKEFLINFDDTGLSVDEINSELRNRKIFGGKDVSKEIPELGQCALYCVTEVHTDEDIDKMVKDAEANKEADKKKRENVDARNQADSLVFSTEKSLKEHGDKVPEEDKNKITADIEELKKVKDGDDIEAIKAKTEALVQSSMKLGEAIYKQDPQAGAPQPDPSGEEPSSDKKDEKVVDAEFEEVDEDKKD